MTVFSFLSFLDSPVCVRLAETLIHFLWQGALVAVLTAAGSLLLRRRSPGIRYAVFAICFLVMAVCPAAP